MPVEPVLALLSVVVLANLVVTIALIAALARGRRRLAEPRGEMAETPGPQAAGRLARPQLELLQEVAPGTYDRIVRIVAWSFLIAATGVVTISGLWPEQQDRILAVLAFAAIFVVVVHDLLPPEALGPARPVVEGCVALTVAGLLVLLTGQVASPFVVAFALVVVGGALVLSPRATAVLVVVASATYLAAVLAPVGSSPPTTGDAVSIGLTVLALVLLAYVAMVVAREQRRSREAAVRASTLDALTGLFNRSFLLAAAEREIARSDRTGRGFCLLMMDLDGLKGVNDRYGHHVGDRLLRAVGGVMRTGVRRIDTPARFGGDEFAVLCPETDVTGAFVLGEKIRLGVRDLAIEVSGGPIRSSISVGVVAYPADGETVEALLIAADQAMYRAKREGKDRVSGWSGGRETVEPDLPVGLETWPPARG